MRWGGGGESHARQLRLLQRYAEAGTVHKMGGRKFSSQNRTGIGVVSAIFAADFSTVVFKDFSGVGVVVGAMRQDFRLHSRKAKGEPNDTNHRRELPCSGEMAKFTS